MQQAAKWAYHKEHMEHRGTELALTLPSPPGEGDEQALQYIRESLQAETPTISLRVNHSLSASPCRQYTTGGSRIEARKTLGFG
jgi:hypothetical protein